MDGVLDIFAGCVPVSEVRRKLRAGRNNILGVKAEADRPADFAEVPRASRLRGVREKWPIISRESSSRVALTVYLRS